MVSFASTVPTENTAVPQKPVVLGLLASEDEDLGLGRVTFLVFDLALDIRNGITHLHLEDHNCPRNHSSEDFHVIFVDVTFYQYPFLRK